MNRLDKREIWSYCEKVSSEEPDYLRALTRETNLKTLAPQMLSESIMGRMLAFISQMIRPDQILELGTFTGYGTLCLAEGLSPNGMITTIEVNPELQHISSRYFEGSPFKNQICAIQGDANEVLKDLKVSFDLIYLDAGKRNYLTMYELALPKLKSGKFLLVDNTLWSGKVVSSSQDSTTQALQEFNAFLKTDDRIKVVLLPIRDGLTLIQKK